MPSAEADGPASPELSDQMLADMVQHLRPSWTLTGFDRVAEGVNATVVLDVDTPTGDRTAVLQAITSSHSLAADRARAEPPILSLVGRETAIPVPMVFDACDDHDTYPTPYYLMEYIEGVTFDHDRAPALPSPVRETIFREAGRNLAGTPLTRATKQDR